MTFAEIGIEEKILLAIEELGFETPMPVQEKVIPYLMQEEHEDIIALAQTGTGKTAAFGLPLIQKTDTSYPYIQYLILSPTRELTVQITNDLKSYAKFKKDVRIAAVFGGARIDNQIETIRRGVHIISATPGRLLDLIKRNRVDLTNIRTVVLDEADEMLNMGFREDLEAILAQMPPEKNTLLFSATMLPEVRAIASKFMHKPVEITIGKRNTGAENVNHICYMVHAKDRYLALKRIVDSHPDIYGIIFCRTRIETQEVADKLVKDGYDADALHGDLSQTQRDVVMNKFRLKHLRLLVATDVAARGLDVDNLSHIVNYNLPDDLEIYTHRSGRTGRAGRKGDSVVIANLREKYKLQSIEKQINKRFKHQSIPLGRDICEKQLFHLIDKVKSVEVNDAQIASFLPAIYEKLEALDHNELIQKFVSIEFNRFLEYYGDTPDLNVPTADRKGAGRSRGRDNVGFTRFFINAGRVDNLRPQDVIGLLNDFTDIRDIAIGKIEILNNFSFFEADSDYTEDILSAFRNSQYRNRDLVVEVSERKGDDFKKFDRKKSNFAAPQRRYGKEKRPIIVRSKSNKRAR